MMDQSIAADDLQLRLQQLEAIVFGPSENGESSLGEDRLPKTLIDTLVEINSKLSTLINSREKTKMLANGLEDLDLEKILDPNYLDELSLSIDSKLQILEVAEPELQRRAELLSQVEALQTVLDSKHLEITGVQQQQLADCSGKQLQQLNVLDKHTTEVSDLVRHYNDAILAISKQFVYYDKILTEYEQKQAAKQNTS